MQNIFRNIFSPPVFPEDERKSRSAYHINVIGWISISLIIVLLIARVALGVPALDTSNLILLAVAVILLVVQVVMKAGAVHLAGYISIAVIWLACTFLAFSGSGIRGTGFVGYIMVMLLAGLLVGVRAAIGIAVLSILSGFSLAYAEVVGIAIYRPDPPFDVAVEYTFIFVICALLIKLTIDNLQNALIASTHHEKELAASNQELAGLRDALELRIQERTASLEKRATQIEAVSRTARAIATVQDLDTLLPNITKQVSEQFGFYHAGIFLTDEIAKNAVLKAANSEGGKRMLNRGHRLAIDGNSIVGYVTSRGEPRIASDVGADAVYFNNPDLPDTRSEMALPLRVSGRIIGALDVQSTQTNAFSEDDISVLSTLADQVAIAIENARLFGEAQNALAEAHTTYDRFVKQSWNNFVQQARHTGFVFDGKHVMPLDVQSKREITKPLPQTGSLSLDKPSATIGIPIKLRGQTIGVLDVRSKKGERSWTRDELTLLEAAAERAALALENARLVESAQRRAARERAIGDISTKIGAVSSFEYILQTAVEELGRKIGGATEVTLEITSEDEQARQP